MQGKKKKKQNKKQDFFLKSYSQKSNFKDLARFNMRNV